MSGWQTLLCEVGDDHVATVTINRPGSFNAFNLRMVREFGDLWREIARDDRVHAVVLRAAAGRVFSPGFDVKDDANILGSDQLWSKVDPGEGLGPKSNRCWKPVITAVHGLCAGGAFYWINESDIVICDETAQFFDPHVTYGMTAALEPIGLRYRIAFGEVLRMALMGNDERICAQTALRIGLVSEVVPPVRLWARAGHLAARIAAKPSAATQGTVRAIWDTLDMPRSAALRTGLNYCLLGNPVGEAQVDRVALMAAPKSYDVR